MQIVGFIIQYLQYEFYLNSSFVRSGLKTVQTEARGMQFRVCNLFCVVQIYETSESEMLFILAEGNWIVM